MGEVAEMMLEGILCAGCGEYLHNDDPLGIPDYCSTDCAPDGHIFQNRSGAPVPHDWTIQNTHDKCRRLEKKGFAVEVFTDFHMRVTAKDGTKIDYWPTGGKQKTGKWKECGTDGKAKFVNEDFWKRLTRPKSKRERSND